MLRILQAAAYGALRPTLVALHLELAPETARRHQLQLRLLSRLLPEHLGLPAAFCARPHRSSDAPTTPPQPHAASRAAITVALLIIIVVVVVIYFRWRRSAPPLLLEIHGEASFQVEGCQRRQSPSVGLHLDVQTREGQISESAKTY